MAMLHRKIWDFGKYIREKQGEAVQSALEKKDELGLRTTRYITKLQVATYGSLGAYFLYETYESWTAFTESQDIVPLVLNATSLGGAYRRRSDNEYVCI